MAGERADRPGETADAVLVRAAQAGDRDAFSVLVDRYREVVFAYALARMQRREEAEDAAQDALARAFLQLSRLRRAQAWSSWLMQIVRNTCRDALRRRRVRQAEPLDETWVAGGDSPEARLLGEERGREIAAAVAALPESLRVPLLMHVMSGCTYREIAVALEVPETTVIGRTSRAVRALRKRCAELDQ